MPSTRTPKGTYTRPTPDWFTDALAYAGGFWTDPGGAFQSFSTFSLYNNDNQGRFLQVYFMSAFWNGASIILGDIFPGTFGTLVANASSVNPQIGQPPGQVFLKSTVVVGSPPNPDITAPTFFFGLGFASAGIGYGAPLAIIPVGQSLRLSNDFVSAESGLTFWYTYIAANK
jgi:hypothetical protein